MKLIIKTSVKKFVYREVEDWKASTTDGNTIFLIRKTGERLPLRLCVPAESIYWVREK